MPDISEALIRVRGLRKVYETPAGNFLALKDVDVEVNRGEFVAVIGKSGSGKSTFINMLTGIDRPSAGEVWVGDTALHRLGENEMAVWRGRTLGIVFQFFQLLPTLTLAENVILPMELNGLFSAVERRRRAEKLLEMVGLGEQADKLPAAVSGGQQQRAAIARALANDPPLIVADEPTGNLDSKSAEQVFALFEALVAEGKTIVFVTHDDEQARRVQRTILLADGEIVNEHIMRVLGALSKDQLIDVARRGRTIEYAPGSLVIRQGDPENDFHIITEGAAEVSIRGAGGKDILVDRLEAGQYFGEMSLLSGGVATAAVRAHPEQGVTTAALDRDHLRQLLEDAPALREQLAALVDIRLTETRLSALTALGHDMLVSISDDAAVRSFEPGEIILRQGALGSTFFVLLEGAVEIVYQKPDGEEVFVDRLQSGQYFGEMALMGSGRRSATVRATRDGRVKAAEFSAADLARLAGFSPAFREDIEHSIDERRSELAEIDGEAA